MVKVLVILATVTFIGHFGYKYQWWKVCDLEFAFEQLASSGLPNVSLHSLEAISGTLLRKQEFAFREATVGMGLEVLIYSYTSRQLMTKKYKYTCTMVVKTVNVGLLIYIFSIIF